MASSGTCDKISIVMTIKHCSPLDEVSKSTLLYFFAHSVSFYLKGELTQQVARVMPERDQLGYPAGEVLLAVIFEGVDRDSTEFERCLRYTASYLNTMTRVVAVAVRYVNDGTPRPLPGYAKHHRCIYHHQTLRPITSVGDEVRGIYVKPLFKVSGK